MERTYSYSMGFKINNTAIPDPSVFTGKDSALDSEGGRDMNGLLHRKMVATKHPTKMEYNNIDWDMAKTIMGLMLGESFNFTYPDPRTGTTTIKAYCGDREWEVIRAGQTRGWICNLKFSCIEF